MFTICYSHYQGGYTFVVHCMFSSTKVTLSDRNRVPNLNAEHKWNKLYQQKQASLCKSVFFLDPLAR